MLPDSGDHAAFDVSGDCSNRVPYEARGHEVQVRICPPAFHSPCLPGLAVRPAPGPHVLGASCTPKCTANALLQGEQLACLSLVLCPWLSLFVPVCVSRSLFAYVVSLASCLLTPLLALHLLMFRQLMSDVCTHEVRRSESVCAFALPVRLASCLPVCLSGWLAVFL